MRDVPASRNSFRSNKLAVTESSYVRPNGEVNNNSLITLIEAIEMLGNQAASLGVNFIREKL